MGFHRERIRRAEWGPFMERFSRVHRGRPVRVGVIDTCLLRSSMETEARPVGGDALFEGFRLDRRADGESLSVVLGLHNVLATHAIRAPRRLYVERRDGGGEHAVRVDSAEGTSLLLQFAGEEHARGEPGRGADQA